MIILYVIGCILMFLICLTVFYAVRYRNPYQLIFVFGKKGTGKTTLLTKLAYDYSRRGWNVYSTEETPNARRFRPTDFGTYAFPPESLILIDEVSLIWSNRDFAGQNAKRFKETVEKQFRLQRHDRLVIYLFSQTFDVDLKIRNLADSMFLATKLFNCVCWLKRVDKSVVLTKSDSSAGSRIAEDLRFESVLLWPFGSRHLIWIPKWARMFNSFDQMEWQRQDMPYDECPEAYPGFKFRRKKLKVPDQDHVDEPSAEADEIE